MNLLVIGSGGREHAICLALAKSPRITKLYCAPGNGGIASIAECVDIAATDIQGVLQFCKDTLIDFVMVAPDDPLAMGMVDALEAENIRAFGPLKAAAELESSKVFSKNLMKKYNIPTAQYDTFTDVDKAKAYIKQKGTPIVIKADGLALGKGVIIALDEKTAMDAVDSMMLDNKFGDSGKQIVIEEYMTGPEVTVLAFTDGNTVVPMLSSQDHKRALTGDKGLNTGGMGAFAPSPNYTKDIAEKCMKTIIEPTIEAMKKENRKFKGIIYFGLMLTPSGPKVIEYNARFGDPETQVILPMLETDLFDIFEAVVDERLHEIDIKWRKGSCCCVVMASGGYPEKYETGYEINGLNDVPNDITVYHAGTALSNGVYTTKGGRVLGVTAFGSNLSQAAARAYEGVAHISFKDMHYRTDIGI